VLRSRLPAHVAAEQRRQPLSGARAGGLAATVPGARDLSIAGMVTQPLARSTRPAGVMGARGQMLAPRAILDVQTGNLPAAELDRLLRATAVDMGRRTGTYSEHVKVALP